MRNKLTKLKTRIKNQKGFTLIELMAVIAILAMIVLIAVPAVGSILEKAKAGSAEAHVAMIENAAELAYVGESTNPAPGELGKKDTYTAKELVDGGYLNAELTPEDEAMVLTRQPNGTFGSTAGGVVNPGADSSYDVANAMQVTAMVEAAALQAYNDGVVTDGISEMNPSGDLFEIFDREDAYMAQTYTVSTLQSAGYLDHIDSANIEHDVVIGFVYGLSNSEFNSLVNAPDGIPQPSRDDMVAQFIAMIDASAMPGMTVIYQQTGSFRAFLYSIQ